jgi:PAS domain S-box-containing protein
MERRTLMKSRNSLDEHQIFLQGPVVVFKWKNISGWPVEYVSSNVKENLGYSKEDFEHGRVRYASIVFEDDLDQVLNEVITYSQGERNGFEQEYRIKKSNGEVIWIYDYTSILRDEIGNITHYYGYILDITKQKKNEEALRRTEKLNTVGEMAAGVAHEIRNPLTTIKGFLSMIKKGQINDRYTDIMESEINRIEQIINEFLILSKPHIKTYNKKDVRLLLNEILPLFGTQAIIKSIELHTQFDSKELVVNCSEGQLKQAFINTLKNAIDATPHGGVITIQCVQEKDSNEVCIRFIDEGVGISEENLKHLGKPFFTTKEGGTGLGLMVSFKIIEEHQGSYQVKSKLGEGSTVEYDLPLVN